MRGVLKVRPHTKSGGGGGGGRAVHFRSDIRKVEGGQFAQVRYEKCVCVCGGGGQFASGPIRKVEGGGGGGGNSLRVRYEKWGGGGGGGQFASGPIRKVGVGGGGGAIRFGSDTKSGGGGGLN